MVKGLSFEATLSEQYITHAKAKNTFKELRKQAADVPEMSLEEINEEIAAARAERKVNDCQSQPPPSQLASADPFFRYDKPDSRA